jgi:rhamnosyltransferase
LRSQQLVPREIIVIDSSSSDGTEDIATGLGCRLISIPREEFSHGGTRNLAVLQARGDILVFLSQDVLPVDGCFLGCLVNPIRKGDAVATYARQIPRDDAPKGEWFARLFNYPEQSEFRTLEVARRRGVKGFFFSNAASAIGKDIFENIGGFSSDVIMNEDMQLCVRLLQAGHRVGYVAEARVFHSHDYSFGQIFRRYFDIGTFFADCMGTLGSLQTNREAKGFVGAQLKYLYSRGYLRAAGRAIVEAGVKYVAFQFGKKHVFLPRGLKEFMSLHAGHWRDRA